FRAPDAPLRPLRAAFPDSPQRGGRPSATTTPHANQNTHRKDSNVNSIIKVTTVVGNPRRLSRTLSASETLAGAIADGLGALRDSSPIDLAELYRHGIEPPHDGLERAIAQVGSSDVLVIGTPVYKASYTGLL